MWGIMLPKTKLENVLVIEKTFNESPNKRSYYKVVCKQEFFTEDGNPVESYFPMTFFNTKEADKFTINDIISINVALTGKLFNEKYYPEIKPLDVFSVKKGVFVEHNPVDIGDYPF
jgi:hypothetical protein